MPYDSLVEKIDSHPKAERSTLVATYSSSSLVFDTFYRNYGKRILDVTLVLLGGFIVLPVTILLAALVALDGHNPIYRQARIGKNGRAFWIIKLRTMVPEADRILREAIQSDPEIAAEWLATQKLKNDFRVTRIGRFLRSTSLDELPQLWNVLCGSMSLVGPRPMMPSQRKLYPGNAYFKLLPGITGPWQVSLRNECAFRDRAHFDDAYERSVSFTSDIKLLYQTVWVVVRGTGH